MHEEPDDEAEIWRAAMDRTRDPRWQRDWEAAEKAFFDEINQRDRPYAVLADMVREHATMLAARGMAPEDFRLGLLDVLLVWLPPPQESGSAATSRATLESFIEEYHQHGASLRAVALQAELRCHASAGFGDLSDAAFYLYDLVAGFPLVPVRDELIGPLPDWREPCEVCFVKALVAMRYRRDGRLDVPNNWVAVIEQDIRDAMARIE